MSRTRMDSIDRSINVGWVALRCVALRLSKTQKSIVLGRINKIYGTVQSKNRNERTPQFDISFVTPCMHTHIMKCILNIYNRFSNNNKSIIEYPSWKQITTTTDSLSSPTLLHLAGWICCVVGHRWEYMINQVNFFRSTRSITGSG